MFGNPNTTKLSSNPALPGQSSGMSVAPQNKTYSDGMNILKSPPSVEPDMETEPQTNIQDAHNTAIPTSITQDNNQMDQEEQVDQDNSSIGNKVSSSILGDIKGAIWDPVVQAANIQQEDMDQNKTIKWNDPNNGYNFTQEQQEAALDNSTKNNYNDKIARYANMLPVIGGLISPQMQNLADAQNGRAYLGPLDSLGNQAIGAFGGLNSILKSYGSLLTPK